MTNEVWIRTIARGPWAVVFAMLGVSLIWFVSPISFARQDANGKYEVTGRWQGKFPVEDGNSASDADNPVAVEVAVKDDGGKLSGTIVFYVIRNVDNKPQVKGKVESALIDPQFDGTTLKFSVKMKKPQSGQDTKVEMQMKLKGATDAELENLDDNQSTLFKMKKVQ